MLGAHKTRVFLACALLQGLQGMSPFPQKARQVTSKSPEGNMLVMPNTPRTTMFKNTNSKKRSNQANKQTIKQSIKQPSPEGNILVIHYPLSPWLLIVVVVLHLLGFPSVFVVLVWTISLADFSFSRDAAKTQLGPLYSHTRNSAEAGEY